MKTNLFIIFLVVSFIKLGAINVKLQSSDEKFSIDVDVERAKLLSSVKGLLELKEEQQGIADNEIIPTSLIKQQLEIIVPFLNIIFQITGKGTAAEIDAIEKEKKEEYYNFIEAFKNNWNIPSNRPSLRTLSLVVGIADREGIPLLLTGLVKYLKEWIILPENIEKFRDKDFQLLTLLHRINNIPNTFREEINQKLIFTFFDKFKKFISVTSKDILPNQENNFIFSSDGTLCALLSMPDKQHYNETGSNELTIRIYNTLHNTLTTIFHPLPIRGIEDNFLNATFSNDNKGLLITIASDNLLRYNLETSHLISESYNFVAFFSNYTYYVTLDNNNIIGVHENTQKTIFSFNSHVTLDDGILFNIFFSPDLKKVGYEIIVDEEVYKVLTYDIASGALEGEKDMAMGEEKRFFLFSYNNELMNVNIPQKNYFDFQGKIFIELQGNSILVDYLEKDTQITLVEENEIKAMRFINSKLLATIIKQNTEFYLIIWNFSKNKKLYSIKLDDIKPSEGITVAKDGLTWAYISRNNILKIHHLPFPQMKRLSVHEILQEITKEEVVEPQTLYSYYVSLFKSYKDRFISGITAIIPWFTT